MLRRRIVLFLIATVVLLGGALLLYGQRTGKLTIFGATPTAPSKLEVTNDTDLRKGVSAGDGNVELVGGKVQLKQGTQFSSWERVSTNTPDFVGMLGLGNTQYATNTTNDSRSWPLNTSFDTEGKKLYASIFTRLFSFDPNSKQWSQLAPDASGTSIFWSNKSRQLVGLQGTGNLQAPTNVSVFNQNGSIAQVLAGNTRFTGVGSGEATYLDPGTGTLVGFQQIDAYASTVYGCSASYGQGNCSATYPRVVEWYDGQYNRFDATTGAWPEARLGASVAYNPDKSEILVFGGFTASPVYDSAKSRVGVNPILNGSFLTNDGQVFSHYTYTPASLLWAFNTQTRSWTQRIGANQPPGRAFSNLTYDPVNKKFYMFGGLTNLLSNVTPGDPTIGVTTQASQTYAASNDLWSYDPATNAWQLVQLANAPDARYAHGIGYDAPDRKLIVYSGHAGGTVTTSSTQKLQDTWMASTGGYASTGTCQFDVGSPQVQQLYRFQSVKTKDLPAGTSVTVRFAGSVDGVAFGAPSQPFTYNASASAPDSIDLTQILPDGTRFVRVLCTLTSNGSATPTFEGFSVDYEAIGTSAPTFAIAPAAGQAPLTVTATRTDSLGTVCTVNFGDGTADVSLSTAQSLSHAYGTPGTYTATMTCNGQTSTQTITVTSQPTATTTLTTSKPTFTVGEPVAFTLQNLGPATVTMDDAKPYVIRTPITSGADSQTIFDPPAQGSFDSLATNQSRAWNWDQKTAAGAAVSPGTYVVTVSYTVTGTSAPVTKNATFTVVAATATAGSTADPVAFTVAPGEGQAPLTVTASHTGTLTDLIWDFGDGTVQSVDHGPSQVTHIYPNAGTYTVSLRSGTQAATQTVLVSSGMSSNPNPSPILVNGSIAGTDTPSSGVTEQPRTLVSTGENPLVLGLIAAWILAAATILTYRPKRTGHAK